MEMIRLIFMASADDFPRCIEDQVAGDGKIDLHGDLPLPVYGKIDVGTRSGDQNRILRQKR